MNLKDIGSSVASLLSRVGPYTYTETGPLIHEGSAYYGTASEMLASSERQLTAHIAAALGRFSGTNIDWWKEAGDLSLSGLVMPVVRWYANTAPEAPLQVIQEEADGKFNPIPEHPLPKLISNINPYFQKPQFWSAVSLSAVCSGNVYFIIKRNETGQPIQLWWVPPYLMAPFWPATPSSDFISFYVYKVQGQPIPIPVRDVLHYREELDHRTQGRTGVSPVAAAMREIVGDSEWATYQALLAKGSGVPPFLLSPKETTILSGMGPDDRRRIREEFERRRGADARGKSILAPYAMDVERLGQNPRELKLDELRYGGQEMICALTGLPPEVLNFGAAARRSSYNNVKEANARAYENVLLPFYKKFESFLDTQLLPGFYPDGKVPQGVRTHFDPTQLSGLQEDVNAYSGRIVDQYFRGVISRAEAKDKLNYPYDPVKDDVYYTDLIQNRFGDTAANLGDGHGNRDATNFRDGTSPAKKRQGKANGDSEVIQ